MLWLEDFGTFQESQKCDVHPAWGFLSKAGCPFWMLIRCPLARTALTSLLSSRPTTTFCLLDGSYRCHCHTTGVTTPKGPPLFLMIPWCFCLSCSCGSAPPFGPKLKKPRAPPPARTENYYPLDSWFVHSPVSNAEFGISVRDTGVTHLVPPILGPKMWHTKFFQKPLPHAQFDMANMPAPMPGSETRRPMYHRTPMPRMEFLLCPLGFVQFPAR